MRALGLAAIVAGWALTTAAPALAQANKCTMEKRAELKVSFEHNRPLIEAEVNGLKVKLLLDTGAGRTTLYSDVAEKAGVHPVPGGGTFYGVGGGRVAKEVTIATFSFGGATVHNLNLFAIDRDPRQEPDVAGLVGEDLFSQTEAEFDLGSKVIRLWKSQNCAGWPLAYWSPAAEQAPLIGGSPSFTTEVKLNGRRTIAELDSGAQRTVVSRQAAELAGAQFPDTGTGKSRGIGQAAIDIGVAAFDRFDIGGETISNVHMAVGDLFGLDKESYTGSHIAQSAVEFPDMLLGADFYASHRVLISNSQRKVYFTYSGGPVFLQPAPAKRQDAPPSPPPAKP